MRIESEVLSQFGRARHLKVKIGDLEFETPNVVLPKGDPPSLDFLGFPTTISEGGEYNFPLTDYIPYGTWEASEGEVLVLQGGIPSDLKDYSLVFVPFANDFCKSPRKAIQYISALRRRMREDALLYLSFPLSPKEVPIFSYIGVDLFDPFWSPLGKIRKIGLKMREISEKVRNWIDKGNLRRYLEIYARGTQRSSSILKLSEKEAYGYLEMGYPVAREGKELMTVFEEAIERPDVKRYCQRIRTRYLPPKSRKLMLILPCSARKPYTYSRTHRIISLFLRGIRNFDLVQEVIVTSPLGAVPRELEEIYPAKNYDVPVTGHWSEEEIKLSLDLIGEILRKGKYEHVIAYVPQEYFFLESISKIEIIKGEFLERESLRRLREEVKGSLEGEEIPNNIKAEIASSILSYQFGECFSLPEEIKIVGRDFRRYRILFRGEQLAAYDRTRGFFSFTLKGAEEVIKEGYYVKIENFVPKGTIFCVGILDADPRIRKGDEVAVYFEDEVRAVGVSLLPGKTLRDSKKGKGVKVRHHVRVEAEGTQREISKRSK